MSKNLTVGATVRILDGNAWILGVVVERQYNGIVVEVNRAGRGIGRISVHQGCIRRYVRICVDRG